MKTVVFIDGAYLDKLLELNFSMAKIDYSKFVNTLIPENCELNKVYYYHCPPYLPHNPNEYEKSRSNNKMKFFGAINQLDKFETRLGRLIFKGINKDTKKPIFVQKRVGVQLAVDFLNTLDDNEVQQIIMIAGDSEYIPLINEAEASECKTTLWYGSSKNRNNNMVHRSLFDSFSETHEITGDIINSCLR